MEILKKNHKFFIKDEYSKNWFKNFFEKGWEEETFHILEYYSDPNKIYIDVGSWIGPTVLYSSNFYKKIIALEPDPVAFDRLKLNVEDNNIENIELVKKCLGKNNENILFGGNEELGNSMSTMLISEKNYENWKCASSFHRSKKVTDSNKIEVQQITLIDLLKEKNIIPEEIKLIKIDIEGGEFILIPHLKDYMKKYKPIIYLSLHPCFLRKDDITMIINIMEEIYEKCYIFDRNGKKTLMNYKLLRKKNYDGLVFES